MKIPKEVQCKTCGKVFCCAKCRQKHEDNSHQEMKAIRQICYICNNRPFPLRTDTKITAGNLLVQHIMAEHLPLRCNRCSKVFLTTSDFKTLTRCTPFAENNANTMDHVCNLERSPIIATIQEAPVEHATEVENKENIDENNRTDMSNHSNTDRGSRTISATAINTKTSTAPAISRELLAITDPIEEIEEPNEALLTPLTKINLRWKRKSRLSFDSMNASNNISAVITGDAGPLSPGKKMARTTSTPMVGAVVPKMKCSNESNTSALGQMSSIHSSGSESDSRNDDHTPISPTSYELEKVRAIVKRSKAAATPLRQVMSKSIQRAIAHHTNYSKMLAPGTQRKMSFSSTGASSETNSTVGSPSRKALDLRTTPVLKRSSSEMCFGNHKNAKIAYLSKAQSEDSSLYQLDDVSKPISEYFETHQNEASLEKSDNADQENRDNHKIVEQSMIASEFAKLKAFPSYYYQDTPKIAGAMLKKAISFTTPEMTRIGENQPDPNESVDVWATPCSIPPRSFSCSALHDTGLKSFSHNGNDTSNTDDVFLPPTKSNSHHKLKKESSAAVPSTGKLWTIVSNVIRLASRTDIREDLGGTDSPEYSSGSDSAGTATFSLNLAQKASSFAGFLRNRLPGRQTTCTSSELDESPSLNRSATKRRRTNSVYTRPYETIGSAVSMRPTSSPLPKRKRIQGRQPIERMRNSNRGSSGSDV